MAQPDQGVKVLVIDDSKTIRRSAETLLSKAGYDVITATDGFDALAKIADSRPEIIFVDYNMPVMDGGEFVNMIHKADAYYCYREVPLVGIGDFPDDGRKHLKDCKSKGFRFNQVEAWIEEYCSMEV